MDGARLTGKGARWVKTGHPWVYRDDLRSCEAGPGEIVPVRAPSGAVLGWGAYGDRSRIALRLVTRGSEPPNLERLLLERLEEAARAREGTVRDATAYRVVSSEADGLPGVVVDRYGDLFAIQTASPAAERWKEAILDWIEERFSPRAIVERNDGAVRDLEGLPRVKGILRGALPQEAVVEEGGIRYAVDLLGGQKTGAFLDQRENRLRVRDFSSGVALDAFAYEGLFGLHALRGGAEKVVAVDSSEQAGIRARENYERNGVGGRLEWLSANVFDYLREGERSGSTFDLVVLDPPAFARNRTQVPSALRGYRELNLRAMRILRPGGVLLSCSCSYNVSPEVFLGILREAAADSGRRIWLLEFRGQASDHPVLLGLPESRYLKCAILRVF